MKALFLDIEQRVREYFPEILFFNMYNGQESMPNTDGDYSFQFPALFVEITPVSWRTLQSNMQDAIISLNMHLMHLKLNDIDGYMERNLEVLDLQDKLNSVFHLWQPENSSMWVRVSEVYDHDHGNVYHLVVNYQFNYNQTIARLQPLSLATPPIAIELQIENETNLNREVLISEDYRVLEGEGNETLIEG
jgi:hypothetical protein